MDYKDYYKILGVPRTADDKAIRRAYRKLAKESHPDLHPDDAAASQRFKDVAEAYEVLGDADKRAKYDKFGAAWRQSERAGGADGFDWSQWGGAPGGRRAGAPGGGRTNVRNLSPEDLEAIFGRGGGGGFSDFFESLFGGGMGGGMGGGAGDDAQAGRRSRVGGSRQAAMPPRGGDLEAAVPITLAEAYGGTARQLQLDGRRIEVRIPPGVKTGSKVRVRGEGQPGQAGAGDLFLIVEVQPDPRFQRDGDDLRAAVKVPLYTALLGGEAAVPMPDGSSSARLTIPPETRNGQRFRLSGKGMPKLRAPDTRGDLFVTVDVELPRDLTDEERSMFETLAKLRPAP